MPMMWDVQNERWVDTAANVQGAGGSPGSFYDPNAAPYQPPQAAPYSPGSFSPGARLPRTGVGFGGAGNQQVEQGGGGYVGATGGGMPTSLPPGATPPTGPMPGSPGYDPRGAGGGMGGGWANPPTGFPGGSPGAGSTPTQYAPPQSQMRQTWGSTTGYTPDGIPIPGYQGGSTQGGGQPPPQGGGNGQQMPAWQNPQLDPNTGRPYQNYPAPGTPTPPTGGGGLQQPGAGQQQYGGMGGAQGMPGQQSSLNAFGGGPNRMQLAPSETGGGGTTGGAGGYDPGNGGAPEPAGGGTNPLGGLRRGDMTPNSDPRYYDPNGGQTPWGQGVTPSNNPYATQGPQVRWNPYTGAYEQVSLQEQSQNAQITGYDVNGNPTYANRTQMTTDTGYTASGQQTTTEQQRQYQNAQQLAQQQAQYNGTYGGQQTTTEQQRQFQNWQNQQAQQFGQGVTQAGVTGQYNGQATMAGQQQQWSQGFQQQQADIQAALQRAQQSGSMTDPVTGQSITTLQGRAQQQAEQQQQFSQQQALSAQSGYMSGSGGAGGTGGQQTLEGELGRGNLALQQQTAAQQWQYQQAMMAANPENYAVTAALRGQAPWQTAMSGGSGGGQEPPAPGQQPPAPGQPPVQTPPGTTGGPSVGLGAPPAPVPTPGPGISQQGLATGAATPPAGQPPAPSQNLRGGIPAARAMSASTYTSMRPDQRGAFNSAVTASGMSANDYQEQMRRYSPQGNRVGAATMR